MGLLALFTLLVPFTIMSQGNWGETLVIGGAGVGVLAVGGGIFAGGLFLDPHPISQQERQRLAQQYNDRLVSSSQPGMIRLAWQF